MKTINTNDLGIGLSQLNSEPKLLEAEQIIENLYSALKSSKPICSVSEAFEHAKTKYRNGDLATRYFILTELIDMEFVGARSLLREALKLDDSALVRHEAAFGLGILRNQEDVSCLEESMLRDENEMVRHEAAISLADVGTKKSFSALKRVLEDEYKPVASSAEFAFHRIVLRSYHEARGY